MWEDQGRQGHGWFGTGTSDTTPDPGVRPATPDDLGRLIAQVAAQHLPRRDRHDFEEFTGQDSGKSLLEAMQVWAEASHLPPAAFRKLVVGPGLTAEGAASLQAMARTLADPSDPAAVAQAGIQLASALRTAGPNNLGYGLSYAQDTALDADANGLVPERVQVSPGTVEVRRPETPTASIGGQSKVECIASCSSYLERPLPFPGSDRNTWSFHRCVSRCMGT